MGSALPELLTELLPTVVYAIAAGVLTIGGFAAEYASFQHLGSGEMTVALWLAAVGCIMLYAGVYGIGYQKVLARLFGVAE